MPTSGIYEVLKRYEFNKTEPETLTGLIDSAIRLGDSARERARKFHELTAKAHSILKRQGLLLSARFSESEMEAYRIRRTVGTDGSFQYVGGEGGQWYVPTSVARILFESGPQSQPRPSITATINEITEPEELVAARDAALLMLIGETKALKEYCLDAKSLGSIAFVDGPLVDPPNYKEDDYVKLRCDALKAALSKEMLVIGCVKRLKGGFLTNILGKHVLKSGEEKRLIEEFPSDIHLILPVFTRMGLSAGETLFTKAFDLSNYDQFHRAYSENGVRIASLFYQINASARPLRLDLLIPEGQTDLDALAKEAVIACTAWTFPGQSVPVPVLLADEKCNVRKGCAEILYEEILTRSVSPDEFESLIKAKMQMAAM